MHFHFLFKVRSGLAWKNQDCRSFTVTPRMLQLFNPSMYKKQDTKEETNIENIDSFEIEEVFSAIGQIEHS